MKAKKRVPSVKEDMPMLYAALGLGVACALLNLSTVIFSQQLVDRILPGGQRAKLFLGLGLLGSLFVLKSLLSYLRQTLLIRQGYQFNIRLTGGFYRSILFLNKSFFDNRKTGDLVARLDDTLRIQQAVSYILGEMAIQSLFLLGTLILLFLYSWHIALFCTLMIPLMYGIVRFFQPDIIRGQRAYMSAHALNESNYVDNIRGIHTIKVMNRESLFAGLARDIFAVFQRAGWLLGRIKARFNAVLELISSLFLLTIIGWATLEVWNGSLRTGQLIAILQLAGMLMQAAIAVALASLQMREAVVALDRMNEFAVLEPEYGSIEEDLHADKISTKNGGVSRFQKLVISNMAFRFPGRKQLLKEISIRVEKGEIIAISGESGQGKSTLLQVLQKFYPYEGGPVLINERELSSIDTPAWRKLIGVVPQEIAVFSGSLLANISLDLAMENEDQVREFCQEYGFDWFFEAYPQSYQTILGEGGMVLSGGQKQLLALARCLYSHPQLLLLDEPTAAMDPATEKFVIGLLEKWRSRTGILIISHKDSLTGIADRAYLLDKGISYQIPQPASFPLAN